MRNNWETKKLGEMLEIQNGFAFDSKFFGDEGVQLIRIRDLKGGFKTETKYSGPFDEGYLVNVGDFLIGMDGEFLCYEWKGESSLLNQRVCRLHKFSADLYDRFLFYGINKYLKDIEDVTTFTTVKHISSKQIKDINFPLPSISEQKRIVKILDGKFGAIQELKKVTEQQIVDVKELFRSRLAELYSRDDWHTTTLDKISKNLDSRRVPVTKNIRARGAIPYYGASGIVDYVEDYIFDDDLLLVSEDGANLLARTYPIAFSVSGKSWVNNHAHVLKFDSFTEQKFIEYYINSISIKDYVTGAAQPKLNQKALNTIPVPNPALSEKKLVVTELDNLSNMTKELEVIFRKKITDLGELKKSYLEQAFSGNL